MIQFIVFCFVAFFTLGLISLILKKVVPILFQLFLMALVLSIGIPVVILCGIPFLLSSSLELIAGKLKIRSLIASILSLSSSIFLFAISWAGIAHSEEINFDLLKFSAPAALLIWVTLVHRKRVATQKNIEPHQLLNKKYTQYYRFIYTAVFLQAVSIGMPDLANHFSLARVDGLMGSWIYWSLSVLLLLYLVSAEKTRISLMASVDETIKTLTKLNTNDYLLDIKQKSFALDEEETEAYFDSIACEYIINGVITEETLNDQVWFFNADWFCQNKIELNRRCAEKVKNTKLEIAACVGYLFGLPEKESTEFAEGHIDFVEAYNFDDGQYVVSYENIERIKTCICCGYTTELAVNEDNAGNWYCSDICLETENICGAIKEKPIESFLADAAISGIIVMEGAAAWSANHKMFAAGGQGHGFAAENANDMIDKMSLKNAKIVGGNNAKDGADRLVDGQHIQTKYCSTGRQSVNEAFHGDGSYRYYDDGGKPMLLEVPKDQYDQALKTMAKKIEDGKVPGVTDPNEAANLIKKGNITYKQAVNITKFGTFESITYDIAEGAVVGLKAGGISFCISSFIYYVNKGDKEEALRVGIIQGGNAFGKSLTVYVVAQQLHRVAMVQKLLSTVNLTSPTLRSSLANGMGVTQSQVNNVLRGTIVTSVAVIAVTTGPDIIKLIRGRMSAAQFTKNLAVVSSSVAGGVAGSIVGGILGAPLGPWGAFAGRTAGGVIGGMAFAAVANKIGKKLMQEDRVKMLKIIEAQIEYLAKTFLLTEIELDNLTMNLDQVIKQESLEVLHASRNRIAMANFFVKPVVIGVIKQRPQFDYTTEELIEVCEGMAA